MAAEEEEEEKKKERKKNVSLSRSVPLAAAAAAAAHLCTVPLQLSIAEHKKAHTQTRATIFLCSPSLTVINAAAAAAADVNQLKSRQQPRRRWLLVEVFSLSAGWSCNL